MPPKPPFAEARASPSERGRLAGDHKPLEYPEDVGNDFVLQERQRLSQEWNTPKAQETKQWLYKGGESPRMGDATYHAEVAHALFLDGKNREAMKSLEQALKRDAKLKQAYLVRSVVYRFLGEYGKSAEDATTLIGLTDDPRHRDRLPDKDDSTYLSLRNLNAEGYFQRGRSRRVQLRYKEALDDLQRAELIMPGFFHVLAEIEDLYRTCPDPKIRDPVKASAYRDKLERLRQEKNK